MNLKARVYVDSGSRDDSVSVADELGFPIIELNAAVPFTAARARNVGFEWLCEAFPSLEFVQFVDADSVLQQGWIQAGAEFLQENEDVAVVCGTLRELDPSASVFNHLCDLEWQVPAGQITSSGGIAMFRCSAFRDCDGFREDLIAGEEPDLCFRLARKGWSIFKIDCPMAIHDAAMTTIAQWWARGRRSGYAAAQALSLRGPSDKEALRRVMSNVLWALPPAWLLWPLQWLRLRRRVGGAYATHILFGKFPQLQGEVSYWLTRARRRPQKLIEYK
jgi:GT2 family glycosyltransferase